jgi:hypothetical protein
MNPEGTQETAASGEVDAAQPFQAVKLPEQ